MKDRMSPSVSDGETVDPREIRKFTALAHEWWDPEGAFYNVHAFNAVRRDFLFDRIARHFDRPTGNNDNLSGLEILDVGCGAGLLSEPLAERGAKVVGIDAAARNIEMARWHADQSGQEVDYRHCLASNLVEIGKRFDVVLSMEVVEHVADANRLIHDCCELVKPGGMMVVATLNRTLRSLVFAIYGAEYVLRWLPKGTHEWRRFLKPAEVESMITPNGLAVTTIAGATFNPLTWRWGLSRDTGVNYMLVAERPAQTTPAEHDVTSQTPISVRLAT